MASRKILVTAALPYANGPIHLGHLAGAYLPADIYVRYQRLKGRDVLFLCGSDEHGVPITLSADNEGVTPQEVVDRYHEENRQAFKDFGMSFDMYSRTSLPIHHETAREFLLNFHERGILKERKEKQLYDRKKEMFLPDRYVVGTCPHCGNEAARGDQCENCGSYLNQGELINPRSVLTGEVPVMRETSHLYFPLGDYEDRLKGYIKERNQRDGWKDNVLKYCESWFRDGLKDRPVTRDLDWGVKIPLQGYGKKVIYVWFDAVLGYVSAAKDWATSIGKPDAWKQYWLDETNKYVAFIGKDNVVFHCLMFPSMLMAWNDGNEPNYVLPENVPANEFLNFEGLKFSKSRGWGVDLKDYLKQFSADSLRYYLATALPEYRDADFYWRDYQARNNNELADILGNFINRSVAFANRTFDGKVPRQGQLTDLDRSVLDAMRKTPVTAGTCYDQYRFRDGLFETMNLARAANKYFNDSKPWATAKSDLERCGTTINISLQIARSLAILMEPVVPFSSRRIAALLNIDEMKATRSWDSAAEIALPEGHRIKPPDITFTKIEDDVIEKQLPSEVAESRSGAAGNTKKATTPDQQSMIDIDDFRKVKLAVAKILGCEKIEKSRNLLKLQVEVGDQKRQVVAGIAKHYEPETLIGKSIVVVTNLKPAKLMGEESQGMLLAAHNDGKLVLVTTDGDIDSGSEVR